MKQQTRTYPGKAFKMINTLASAASPYLLQHKDNPVHWQEWSPQTLAMAQELNKPILLSIGYAACHWCHVMAHESFEDESTAALMNELFINIKVDREERPDIDQIYMAALHALGQHGGWPLTMFLTPKGEPFWGGTYFPPAPSHGRPGFSQVLKEVARVFRDSPDRVEHNAEALRQSITSRSEEEESRGTKISNDMLNEFARRLYPNMDNEYGGLQGAPKFPNCQILELFARAAERTGVESFYIPVWKALDGMCRGGIHDHLGGGFARYSTDERWHVPHFEKMLYDNAQILELLALGWRKQSNEVYRTAAEGIVRWLQREMLVDGKRFAASQDADSDGIEGKYYCWTLAEISTILSPDEAAIFSAHYDVQPLGNWLEPHTNTRTNVLHTVKRQPASPEQELVLSSARQKLLDFRQARTPPLTDDKVLADWNGLMIAALARAAIIFEQPAWLDMARACFHSVIESMARIEDADIRLAHSARGGQSIWPGMASDYAYLIRAALTLQEAGASYIVASNLPDLDSYTRLAHELAKSLIKFHADPQSGILALPATDASDVLYRTYTSSDDATPSPTSMLLQSLQALAVLEEGTSFLQYLRKAEASITQRALKNPFGHASFLNTLDLLKNGVEIVITGHDREFLLDRARSELFLNRIIIDGGKASTSLPRRFATAIKESEASAFICKGETCSLPISEPEEMSRTLRKMKADGYAAAR